MRNLLWVLVLVSSAGCKNDDVFVTMGPEAGPQIMDAKVVDADLRIHGHVCLLKSDLRDLKATLCATTGAGSLTVKLGTAMAMTSDAGDFVLAREPGTDLTWQVSGANIYTSLMSFSPIVEIPVVTTTEYDAISVTNGAVAGTGQGGLVVHLVHNDLAVGGSTATTTPAGSHGAFYDNATNMDWTGTATTSSGAIWVPAIPVTTDASITITSQTFLPATLVGLPIADKSITFVTVDFP